MKRMESRSSPDFRIQFEVQAGGLAVNPTDGNLLAREAGARHLNPIRTRFEEGETVES